MSNDLSHHAGRCTPRAVPLNVHGAGRARLVARSLLGQPATSAPAGAAMAASSASIPSATGEGPILPTSDNVAAASALGG
jgi:hypothetical protein